jgi:adenosylmethionine-8-amino-7-oxononanoate aminotransferase
MNDPVNMKTISDAFVKAGVWIRPFGKLVYLMPPFIIENEQLALLTQAMVSTLSEYHLK